MVWACKNYGNLVLHFTKNSDLLSLEFPFDLAFLKLMLTSVVSFSIICLSLYMTAFLLWASDYLMKMKMKNNIFCTYKNKEECISNLFFSSFLFSIFSSATSMRQCVCLNALIFEM